MIDERLGLDCLTPIAKLMPAKVLAHELVLLWLLTRKRGDNSRALPLVRPLELSGHRIIIVELGVPVGASRLADVPVSASRLAGIINVFCVGSWEWGVRHRSSAACAVCQLCVLIHTLQLADAVVSKIHVGSLGELQALWRAQRGEAARRNEVV